MLSIDSPKDVAKHIAERLRQRRLEYSWSREELSHRSGINVTSIKRFELQGEIALTKLLSLCMTLRALDDFDDILKPTPIKSLSELKQATKKRQRGKRRTS